MGGVEVESKQNLPSIFLYLSFCARLHVEGKGSSRILGRRYNLPELTQAKHIDALRVVIHFIILIYTAQLCVQVVSHLEHIEGVFHSR